MEARSSAGVLILNGRPWWIFPIRAIRASGTSLAKLKSGQVKLGPFVLRSRASQSASAPNPANGL